MSRNRKGSSMMRGKTENLRRVLYGLLLVCVMIITTIFTGSAAHADTTEGSETGDGTVLSLTLTGAETGTTYTLYQVESKANGTLTPTEMFAACAVDWDLSDSEKMRTAAVTLTAEVQSRKPASYAEVEADAEGTVAFGDLPEGLYLAIGEETENSAPSPVLAFLPYADSDGNMVYNVEAAVKANPKTHTTTVSVCKIWKGDTEANRPASIQVTLMDADGAVGDPITLSEENNWQYTWEDLDAGSSYTVVEQVPDGYTWKLTEDNGAFTITNTRKPETTVTPTPSTTPKVTTTPTVTPTNTPLRPTRTTTTRLPQTGQFWWPAILLAEIGIFLIILGIYLRKKR